MVEFGRTESVAPTAESPNATDSASVDRRRFLAGLALAGVVAGCARTDEGDPAGETSGRAVPAEPAPADLPDGVFALGVASGDPLADRVMLWTRLASDPLAADGGAPAGEVEVGWDVARDDAFADLVASGVAVAQPALGHSLHVDVAGLEPDTWYHYRFRAGDQVSPVGRTRTFPSAGAAADRFRFVFASCQDYQWGRYGAWRRAAEQPDVDAVVFLGDYVYELNLGDLSPDRSGERVWAGPEPFTVAEYRRRYAETKADPHLAAAHAMAPWLITFDDHEVSNNYAGDVAQEDIDQPNSRDRRLAGYQAWWEHTPIRITPSPTDFDELEVHRGFRFGDLAAMFVIETRQHADPPPCRTDGGLFSDDGPLCDEAFDEERTILGAEQEAWLLDGLAGSDASWNIIANPVMLATLDTGTPEEPSTTRDMWDGYPAARSRLVDHIVDSGVSNPVVVTGDWHASFVLEVEASPGEGVVLPEFLVSAISSIVFGTDYTAGNPHVRYFRPDNGFAVVTITTDRLECEFHHIDDVWSEDPEVVVDTWAVESGDPRPIQV